MERTGRNDLAVYVVWSPQLGARERHVPDAARLMADPRVRHYWDGEMAVGTRYAGILGLDSPAWDVWLLFGREAVWGDPEGAPEPAWWEHQLQGLPDSLRLDPERFAGKAMELLEKGSM